MLWISPLYTLHHVSMHHVSMHHVSWSGPMYHASCIVYQCFMHHVSMHNVQCINVSMHHVSMHHVSMHHASMHHVSINHASCINKSCIMYQCIMYLCIMNQFIIYHVLVYQRSSVCEGVGEARGQCWWNLSCKQNVRQYKRLFGRHCNPFGIITVDVQIGYRLDLFLTRTFYRGCAGMSAAGSQMMKSRLTYYHKHEQPMSHERRRLFQQSRITEESTLIHHWCRERVQDLCTTRYWQNNLFVNECRPFI